MNKYKKAVQNLLAATDIEINGSEFWDIQVHNENFYKRVMQQGSLGLGESYMEGWWDCEKLDECMYRLFKADIEKKVKSNLKLKWLALNAKLLNGQTKKRAEKSIASHYNIGNELYQKMLDPLMMYSCGYWKEVQNLTKAQEKKLELICRKLQLKAGQKVLDIGCGWGGFAYYAAKNHHVEVTGITLSKEQYSLATERCKDLPVEIHLQDYRDLDGKYDRIVSIGMLEHVGYKNYGAFMDAVQRTLNGNGICLLQYIANNKSQHHTDPWIDKYIFPEGMMPSIAQIGDAIENKLILQDTQNFGPYYDQTLMAWHKNFKAAWAELQQSYDQIFYRMWEFYLCSSAASFRSRRLQTFQLVLTKKEYPAVYHAMRHKHFKTHEFAE